MAFELPALLNSALDMRLDCSYREHTENPAEAGNADEDPAVRALIRDN